jgi:8-oxo-dGTP pyrophosphatase MutT (NUDIX family)
VPSPVRPRDAATLVAWRRSSAGLEVLMGRRAARHRFVPHHYVFPGGRVDRADYAAPLLSPLRPESLRKLCDSCVPRLAQALAVAAVRETWEETGLVLGDVSGDRIRPDLQHLEYALRAITPPQSPVRFHARFFLVEGERLDGALRSNGELLDLAWRPIDACLRLPIVDVTEYVLRKLDAGLLPTSGAQAPLFSFRKGKALLAQPSAKRLRTS